MNVVVLISGRGSNLRSIISAMEAGTLPVKLRAVISNNESASGLDYAKAHAINTHALNHKTYDDRQTFDQALMKVIDQYQPDLVVLAGFMRLLTENFVNHYLGKLINIHPSLLPAYRGLNTHQRALDDGAAMHGASVHFVTPELDGGPVIAQSRVPVHPNDSAAQLAERVLTTEHILYPTVISWFANNRLKMLSNTEVLLDGKPLDGPIFINGNQASYVKFEK
jgi:phosphoribosylglycinamide formyltransferase-1